MQGFQLTFVTVIPNGDPLLERALYSEHASQVACVICNHASPYRHGEAYQYDARPGHRRDRAKRFFVVHDTPPAKTTS